MQVEKFHWKTEDAFQRVKSGRPVVLLDCPIICPSYANWSLQSLAEMINEDFRCDVFVSPSPRFPYFDLGKNEYAYAFDPPTRKVSLTFKEFLFLRAVHSTNNNDRNINDNNEHCNNIDNTDANDNKNDNNTGNNNNTDDIDSKQARSYYYYMHQSLVAEMGKKVLDEYTKFSLQTAAMYKVLSHWNELTHNMLLCGGEGFVTPLHFDEQENLFTQLQGRKRVRLFSPDHWPALYPFPNGHPQDRQSQVTLPATPGDTRLDRDEDVRRFPAFANAARHEMYVDLEPGEVLYIPQYWFHQMEGLSDNISLSWWFKHSSHANLDYKTLKITDVSLIAVRRNIESMMAQLANRGKQAQALFLSIASGKVRLPGVHYRTAPSSSSLRKPLSREKSDSENNEAESAMPAYCTADLLVVDTDAGALKLDHGEDESFANIVNQALRMLEVLFKDNAGPFLLQVVSGRFNTF